MFENTALGEMLKRVIAIDETKVFIAVSDNDVLRKVEQLNRDQLFQGIDSAGESLSDIGGEYSDLTLELAEQDGRPKKDRFTVNLFDSGEYHESITARVTPEGWVIDSDPLKEDFGRVTNLTERWGKDIEGLTKESIEKIVREMLIGKYIEYLKTNIF